MTQTLEETKERLWKIKDDEDFEQKSQRIIEETIKEVLKFLHNQVTEIPVSNQEKERDTRMKLAQELLTTAKNEEDHIFDTVDYHATHIAKELD